MAKRRAQATERDEIDELRQEVADLKNHVGVLIDAIDELRQELQWLTRNGLPSREEPRPIPVLKRMAADPCAADWGERLVIERGETPTAKPNVETPPADPPAKPPPGKLFADPDD